MTNRRTRKDKKLPPDEDLKMLFFDWGLRYKDIAAIYGTCTQGIDSKFRRMGFRKGHWKIPDDDALIPVLSDPTKTRDQQAMELGISNSTVCFHANRLGLRRLPPMQDLPSDEELIRLYCDEQKSSNEIATEHLVGAVRVRQRLEILGRLRDQDQNGSIKARKFRQKHTNGRQPRGYLYPGVSAPGHPRASKCGWVALHVIVAEKKLGRRLLPGEIVHHLDMNRANNDASNIYVCKNRHEHNAVHASLQFVGGQLFAEGVLGFEKGEYRVKKPKAPLFAQVVGPRPTLSTLEQWRGMEQLKAERDEPLYNKDVVLEQAESDPSTLGKLPPSLFEQPSAVLHGPDRNP